MKNLTFAKDITGDGKKDTVKDKTIVSRVVDATCKFIVFVNGKQSIFGNSKKMVVKVPKKQLNAYKKLLRGSGISAKAVYKKF